MLRKLTRQPKDSVDPVICLISVTSEFSCYSLLGGNICVADVQVRYYCCSPYGKAPISCYPEGTAGLGNVVPSDAGLIRCMRNVSELGGYHPHTLDSASFRPTTRGRGNNVSSDFSPKSGTVSAARNLVPQRLPNDWPFSWYLWIRVVP
jgi:hypothetical protein